MRYLMISLMLLASLAHATDDQYAQLRSNVAKAFPGMKVTSVTETPMENIVQVEINGVERLYSSLDGQYLMSGEMFAVRPQGGVVNLAEQQLSGVRKAGIKELKPADMITYAAKDEKSEVFVFTDTSCGYCRRLHQHIAEYNDMGITVHYLAFPRGGMNSSAANTMRAVWCEKDRKSALTEAKLNGVEASPAGACKDPVAEQYNLGVKFGVRGTPSIYTQSGENIGGYLTPADMAEALHLTPSPSK